MRFKRARPKLWQNVAGRGSIVLASLQLLATTLAAQTYSEGIQVTAVEVPVQVFIDGKPVRGLTQSDFEIYAEGELQEITGFDVLDLSPVAGRAPRAATAGTEDGASTAPTFERRRYLLVLFDFEFSQGRFLSRGLLGARTMVESQLHPSDRVAIATYNGNSGVRILVGFTANRSHLELGLAVIEAVLDGKSRLARSRLRDLDEVWGNPGSDDAASRSFLQSLFTRLGPAAAGTVSGRRVSFGPGEVPPPMGGAGSAMSAIRTMGLAFADLAVLLRDLPSPKHLIFLSQGLPGDLDTSSLERLKPMLRAFRTSSWVLHGIDLGGIPPPPAADTRISPEDAQGRFTSLPVGATGRVGFDAESLFYLANETGGQVYENYNRLAPATETVLERTAVTYILAFQTEKAPAPGSFHSIEVRLKESPGKTRILHRPGYDTPRRSGKRSAAELRMDAVELVFGNETLDELPARIGVWEPATADGLAVVPLVVEVPGSALLDRRRSRARLEIHAYALDTGGGIHDLLIQEIKLDLAKTRSRLAAGGLRFRGSLEVPAGDYRIRTLVQDRRSGARALATHTVSAPPAGGSARSPAIFFFDRRDRWVDVEEKNTSAAELRAAALFVVDGERWTPTPNPAAAITDRLEVLALSSAEDTGGATPTSRVMSADGDLEVPDAQLSWEELDPAGDRSRYLGRLVADGMSPGGYYLEVGLAASTAAPLARLAFSVTAPE